MHKYILFSNPNDRSVFGSETKLWAPGEGSTINPVKKGKQKIVVFSEVYDSRVNGACLFFLEYLQEMEANVTVNCVHPGIVRTRLTRDREGFITGILSIRWYIVYMNVRIYDYPENS